MTRPVQAREDLLRVNDTHGTSSPMLWCIHNLRRLAKRQSRGARRSFSFCLPVADRRRCLLAESRRSKCRRLDRVERQQPPAQHLLVHQILSSCPRAEKFWLVPKQPLRARASLKLPVDPWPWARLSIPPKSDERRSKTP